MKDIFSSMKRVAMSKPAIFSGGLLIGWMTKKYDETEGGGGGRREQPKLSKGSRSGTALPSSSPSSSLQGNQPTSVEGGPISLQTSALNYTSSILQRFLPLHKITTHLVEPHMYNGEPQRQVLGYHYCAHPANSEDVHQCIIYDSDRKDAKLIGVEYIISDRLFKELPDDERVFWHSHHYEVKSGLLVAPGLGEVTETEQMKKLVNTYGKTFHFWQVDKGHTLPIGPPKLMMAVTRDGQTDTKLVQSKDNDTGVPTAQRRQARLNSVAVGEIIEGADHWMTGTPKQFALKDV